MLGLQAVGDLMQRHIVAIVVDLKALLHVRPGKAYDALLEIGVAHQPFIVEPVPVGPWRQVKMPEAARQEFGQTKGDLHQGAADGDLHLPGDLRQVFRMHMDPLQLHGKPPFETRLVRRIQPPVIRRISLHHLPVGGGDPRWETAIPKQEQPDGHIRKAGVPSRAKSATTEPAE